MTGKTVNYTTQRGPSGLNRSSRPARRSAPALLLACPLLISPSVKPQSNTGSIDGIVTDRTGAVVPHATVTVTNENTGAVRTVVTDTSGVYTVPSLPPGIYDAAIAAPGFARVQTRLTVSVEEPKRWDTTIAPGTVATSVTVSDTAARVDTETHQLAETLDARTIENLPANGRSVFSTLTYSTNVEPYSGGSGNDIGYSHTQANSLVVGGGVFGTTGFLQDGVTNFNCLTKTANYQPSIEAVQEVSLVRNGASAPFDSPNIVNVITKSGTNQVHGRVYDFFQNNALNAIGEFRATSPPLRYNQFGANIGGPILRNRLFFFLDYAGLRQHSSSIFNGLVPTVAQRNGDFSAITKVIYDPSTYDPKTGAISPFPQNQIQSSRISPLAQQLLTYFPLPTASSVSGTNFQKTLYNVTKYDSYLGRLDYTIGTRDTLYGAFMTTNPSTLNQNYAAVPYFNHEYLNGATNAYVQEIHVFSPRLVNALRVGYNRSNIFDTFSGVGKQLFAQQLGLTALQNTPLIQSLPPTITFATGRYSGLGAATVPQGALQNLFQYSDELTWTRGRHTIAGGELDRIQFDGNWVIYNNGVFRFNGQYTSNNATKQAGGDAFADFLLGFPYQAQGGIGSTVSAFRQYNIMPFVQDDWRVSPRLTLNLGVRYDYTTNPPTTKTATRISTTRRRTPTIPERSTRITIIWRRA